MDAEMLRQNRDAWNAVADEYGGGTALPQYGMCMPTEDQLHLLGDVRGKRMLEIGCGSGRSLRYLGERGAAELWGLDLSERQIQNAARRLQAFSPRLFVSPMEQNPGLPLAYFDTVYSIYALGWTVDLDKTLALIASYLKVGGFFLFSWDHPLLRCVSQQEGRLVWANSYFDTEPLTFEKGGMPLKVYPRKLSDYINALARAGFAIENLVEETDEEALQSASSSAYYALEKARNFPLSFVLKAGKIRGCEAFPTAL